MGLSPSRAAALLWGSTEGEEGQMKQHPGLGERQTQSSWSGNSSCLIAFASYFAVNLFTSKNENMKA